MRTKIAFLLTKLIVEMEVDPYNDEMYDSLLDEEGTFKLWEEIYGTVEGML